MNTAPITPQAAVSSSSSAASALSAPRGGKSPSGDASFDRVLSQEVSQRNAADDAPKAAPADAAPAPKTDGSSKAKAADDADRKDAKKDTDTPEADAAGTGADGRIDLLALVTDSSRFAAGAGRGDASQDGKADPAAIGGKGARPPADAGLPAAAQDAATGARSGDGQPAVSAKAAPDFGAALAQSAGAKAALADAAAKALPKQDAVEPLPGAETMAVPLQQTATAVAAAASGAAAAAGADRLAPQVGTPAWDQALGQKIVWMVGSAQQTASLSLNPPDLGPLQVVLSVSNTQASATFVAAQPEVRQALEAAMPRLRDMMSDAGIQLGQASVNAGMPNGQQAMPQPQQHFQAGQREAGGSAAARAEPVTAPAAGMRVLASRGMVDTFA